MYIAETDVERVGMPRAGSGEYGFEQNTPGGISPDGVGNAARDTPIILGGTPLKERDSVSSRLH